MINTDSSIKVATLSSFSQTLKNCVHSDNNESSVINRLFQNFLKFFEHLLFDTNFSGIEKLVVFLQTEYFGQRSYLMKV